MSPRQIDWPTVNGRPAFTSELYGEQVLSLQVLQKSLPKPVYARFIEQVQGGMTMDRPTADAVAHAARVWAMEKGATHFTHWFQPQTGTTACKHDNFLTLKYAIHGGVMETFAMDAFSGSQLLQSEPDASSFPNGGIRSTFEARGYTIWDTSSPMYIRKIANGSAVLYIPSVFIAYNGEALDERTILLRSQEALSNSAVKLLRLLGDKQVNKVITTLGCEQEFFLIDRETYKKRPDLKITGRTLVGSVPPKHQQLEDHYFGQMPSRVLSALSETELELCRLGVPIKTRHNEVAPNQFEMAPIFETANVAVDHNLLTMETLHQVAHRYGLKVLFHEKPFKGVNGSGKHANWSMSTDYGDNLLDPTLNPEKNPRFLLVLVSILDAVLKHGALLRAGIASASNEHRLGANEAPPAILSAFLGDHLNEVLNAIEENRDLKEFSQPHLQTVKVGGTVLDLKVAGLPAISRDLTDRNRTSPFAFTGNKFEFRAVGAKQSPSLPVCLLNTAVSASFDTVTEALKKQMGSKQVPSNEDIMTVVRQFIKATKNIRFEGNNYSQEWVKEAEKRGLPNLKTAPDAFKTLTQPEHYNLLVNKGILTQSEVKSRYYVLCEKYSKDLIIESNTLKNMIRQSILPAAFVFRGELLDTLFKAKQLGIDIAGLPEKKTLDQLTILANKLQESVDALENSIEKVHHAADASEEAEIASKLLTVGMEEIRELTDSLEAIVAHRHWPYPQYSDLLF